LRIHAFLLPIVLFASVAVLASAFWRGPIRRGRAFALGIACYVAAAIVGASFGRLLSGQGPSISFGPFPEGVPVNVIANMDPNAPAEKRRAALQALASYVLDYARAKGDKPGLKEFEERVAPTLVKASKCPDFVMDRGHDYEFMRQFTDAEKQALIELLKTF
jgi:hypothetical protein